MRTSGVFSVLVLAVGVAACGGSDDGGDAFAPPGAGGTGHGGQAHGGAGQAGGVGAGQAGSGGSGAGGAGEGGAAGGSAGGAGGPGGSAGAGGLGGAGSAGASAGAGASGSPSGAGGSAGASAGASGSPGGAGGSAGAPGGSGGAGGAGGGGSSDFPKTCLEASEGGSALGCEFWPVVTANLAWEIFDFAVVVTNPGTAPAHVTVSRGAFSTEETIAPSSAAPIYLPWVSSLKGPPTSADGSVTTPLTATVRENGGAYKLVSDVPVGVVQHNPIEYAGGKGGPAGKDWSACPGSAPGGIGCFSFSSDSSALLPRHSLGTSHRILQAPSWVANGTPVTGSFVSIAGVEDGTTVTVQTGTQGALLSGGGVTGGPGGKKVAFALDAGDVVELVGPASGGDFSGTTVTSTKPVQVIGGIPCAQVPLGEQACDHLEEAVWPTTALGSEYVVAPPTGPKGDAPGLVVRLGGLHDGTVLSYAPAAPPGAPTTLDEGQVVELALSSAAYRVMGTKDFAVALLLPGGAVLDPLSPAGDALGDPSLSYAIPTARYAKKAVFGVPSGYDVTYVDVVTHAGEALLLDGVVVAASPTVITPDRALYRVPVLTPGYHLLESAMPFGAQLIGYGKYTSYMHPVGSRFPK